MTKADAAFYERVPSRRLRQALAPDGFLASLLVERTVAGVDLELHLRRGDEVHLYCGLTCLVKSGLAGRGSVWIESHRTYASQPCATRLIHPERTRGVGRDYRRNTWSMSESGLADALDTGSRGRFQLVFGGAQQRLTFAPTLFAQQRIEAGDEAFAGKVRMMDLGQVGGVEQ